MTNFCKINLEEIVSVNDLRMHMNGANKHT